MKTDVSNRTVVATMINDEVRHLKAQDLLLHGAIDHIYVIQNSETFSGIEKPLHLDDVEDSFRTPMDVISMKPDAEWKRSDSWGREEITRRWLYETVCAREGAESLVLMVDIDEFICPLAIPRIHSVVQDDGDIARLGMSFDYFFLGGSIPVEMWAGRALRSGTRVKNFGELRNSASQPLVPDAGFHVSFCLTPEQTSRKIKSFSHTELAVHSPLNEEFFRVCRKLGVDPFGRFLVQYKERNSECALDLLRVLPEAEPPADWLEGTGAPFDARRVALEWAQVRQKNSSSSQIAEVDQHHLNQLRRLRDARS